MNEEKRPLDAPATRQPTFVDALAELARGLSRGSGVDRSRGGSAKPKIARAPRRSCCSGKR